MKFRNLFRRRERDDEFLRVVPLPDPPDVRTLGIAVFVLGEFDCRECAGSRDTRVAACHHEKAADEVSDWLYDVLQALMAH